MARRRDIKKLIMGGNNIYGFEVKEVKVSHQGIEMIVRNWGKVWKRAPKNSAKKSDVHR